MPLTGIHEGKISEVVSIASAGDNVIVVGDNDSWIYVHELIGSPDAADVITIKAGSRELAQFDLAAGQGITLDDVPGDDGVPRFECKPGEDFIINSANGEQFTGGIQFSRRY